MLGLWFMLPESHSVPLVANGLVGLVAQLLSLRDAFFNPRVLNSTGIEPLLKYLVTDRSQEIDTIVVDDVRNFLFGAPGEESTVQEDRVLGALPSVTLSLEYSTFVQPCLRIRVERCVV